MPASVAAALTAIAVSRGRSVIQSSSPSTARVAQACSSAGLGKTTGLAVIQAPTIAAWLHRRVHAGTSTSGVLIQRVQALHGLEWRAKTVCLRSAKPRGMSRSFLPELAKAGSVRHVLRRIRSDADHDPNVWSQAHDAKDDGSTPLPLCARSDARCF